MIKRLKPFNPGSPIEALMQLNERVRVLEAYIIRLENRRPLRGKPVAPPSENPPATTSWGKNFPRGQP
ncbi:hypothetical protein LCGC14_1537020 [marine sediment metagenome]|uniref:Uncharacterized protein n=1 Tax=marine sediment metagenome TaxID=412755 RepID=A0A0F9JF58_9ZZZZ